MPNLPNTLTDWLAVLCNAVILCGFSYLAIVGLMLLGMAVQ
jgi:hypothetical protein